MQKEGMFVKGRAERTEGFNEDDVWITDDGGNGCFWSPEMRIWLEKEVVIPEASR